MAAIQGRGEVVWPRNASKLEDSNSWSKIQDDGVFTAGRQTKVSCSENNSTTSQQRLPYRDAQSFQFWAVRQTKVSCSEKTRAEQLYHKSAASALSRRTIKAKHIKVGSQSEPVVAGSVQGSSLVHTLTLLGPAACTQVRPAPVGHRKHREAPADARVCVSYRPRSPCFD